VQNDKTILKDNEVEYEYIDVDLSEEKEKEHVRQHIIEKGGDLSYPTILVDDTILIRGSVGQIEGASTAMTQISIDAVRARAEADARTNGYYLIPDQELLQLFSKV